MSWSGPKKVRTLTTEPPGIDPLPRTVEETSGATTAIVLGTSPVTAGALRVDAARDPGPLPDAIAETTVRETKDAGRQLAANEGTVANAETPAIVRTAVTRTIAATTAETEAGRGPPWPNETTIDPKKTCVKRANAARVEVSK